MLQRFQKTELAWGTTLPTLIIWRKKIPQTLRSNHFLLQTNITKKEQNRTEQRLTVSEHWTWFGTPSWATSKTPPPFGPPPFSSLSDSLPLSIWNTTAAALNSSLENVFYSDDEEQGMDKDLQKKWIFRNRKKAFGWHRLKIWANSPAQQASTVCVCVSEEAKKKRDKRRDRLEAKHPVASLLFPTSVPHDWGDRNHHLVHYRTREHVLPKSSPRRDGDVMTTWLNWG